MENKKWYKNWRFVAVAVSLCSLAVWYQNCLSTATFRSNLRLGMVNGDGNVDGLVDVVPTPSPTPSPEPTVSPVPSESPTPTASGNGDKLCIVLNANNQGQDSKVGYDVAVVYLSANPSIPNAVCMSANACLNEVNNYLNLTGGVFGGHVGTASSSTQQYTAQKDNAVCSGNPNVVHLSDDQVQQEIDKLKLNH